LSKSIGFTAEYLDTKLENRGGTLVSDVFHKPSHERYFLPFTSIHAQHIKRNIPFISLIRAVRYCSSYDAFKHEENYICVSLLLNKYPLRFILRQFDRVFKTYQCSTPTSTNFLNIRKIFLDNVGKETRAKKAKIDFETIFLCHFTFCKGMENFSAQFNQIWKNCFSDTAICKMKPVVGTRKLQNLQDYLVKKKPDRALIKIIK